MNKHILLAVLFVAQTACFKPFEETSCDGHRGVVDVSSWDAPVPGWEAVVAAAEHQCNGEKLLSGTIAYFKDRQGILPANYAGQNYYPAVCEDFAVGVRWNSDAPTANRTTTAHELCHAVCGAGSEDEANECAARLNAEACQLDERDCT